MPNEQNEANQAQEKQSQPKKRQPTGTPRKQHRTPGPNEGQLEQQRANTPSREEVREQSKHKIGQPK